jgi:hypothetical protein
MIYSDSRYATGYISKTRDARTATFGLGVTRQFPTSISEFYYYTWTERDRIDLVAYNTLGSVDLWWRIMDYNPEILNAADIPLGTLLRIPSA